MLNPREYLLDLKEVSFRVNEYLEGEYYRHVYPNDVILSDQDLLNLSIPLLVADLKDLGIVIDLTEADYLYNWEYSEAIIALRKYLDKDNLHTVFSINSARVPEVESIFEILNHDTSSLIFDFLLYLMENNLGDSKLLHAISYLDNEFHSTELFKSHVLAVCKDITKKGIFLSEEDVKAYTSYMTALSTYTTKFNKVLTYLTTSEASPLYAITNVHPKIPDLDKKAYIEDTYLSKIQNGHTAYYQNEARISKLLWIFKNPDKNVPIIYSQLGKTKLEIASSYPYAISYFTENKNIKIGILELLGIASDITTKFWLYSSILTNRNTKIEQAISLFAPDIRITDKDSILTELSSLYTNFDSSIKYLYKQKAIPEDIYYYLKNILKFVVSKFNLTTEDK